MKFIYILSIILFLILILFSYINRNYEIYELTRPLNIKTFYKEVSDGDILIKSDGLPFGDLFGDIYTLVISNNDKKYIILSNKLVLLDNFINNNKNSFILWYKRKKNINFDDEFIDLNFNSIIKKLYNVDIYNKRMLEIFIERSDLFEKPYLLLNKF